MNDVLLLVFAAGIGAGGGYYIRQLIAQNRVNSAETRAETILTEAKNKQSDLLLQAKDKALAIIEDAKKEENSRRKELSHIQKRIETREELFDKKLLDLEAKQQKLYDTSEELKKIKERLKTAEQEHLEKLEKVAQLSQQEAQEVIIEKVKESAQESLMSRIKKVQEEVSIEVDKKAKELLSMAIMRYGASHAVELSTTNVPLPSDEMKGRIIGKEGRNIRAFENVTGVDVIIDDTPEAITLSCFSPIRREVAKRAMERLIKDGRIQPARIEEAVLESKRDLAVEIKKAGEEAVYEVGIPGLDPKLVQIIGRLKYRTSYGQNILRHSIETAFIAGLLAQDLGADVKEAKKGGLLHDIGKAFDHEIQGTHVDIGINIGKKFNLGPKVMSAIGEHHDDMPTTLEGVIVKVADAISGARPGARRDSYENYLQRLDDLEKLTYQFEGVERAYAIQAGREIRVFVHPQEINDVKAHELACEISKKIESELTYPGEIKVNVIRELRVQEFAR